MLTLILTRMPSERVHGIYTISGQQDKMPERALYLHPTAARSYLEFADVAKVSDMFRSPESSLNAVRTGRGAQPPGWSAHNSGFACDYVVDHMMRTLGMTDKKVFDRWMQDRGWYCHRRDGKRGHEDWHYNYLRAFEQLGLTKNGAPLQLSPKAKYTSGDVEQLIQRVYGDQLSPSDVECQAALKKLGLYNGSLDGQIGPQSREAIGAFQRAWIVTKNSRGEYVPSVNYKLDARTRRTLAFVAAEKRIVA